MTNLADYGIVGPTYGTPIPPLPPQVSLAPLPFRAEFSAAEERIVAGETLHFFVPQAFWIDGRGVAESRATPQYATRKLHDQFGAWQAKDERRATMELVVMATQGHPGDDGDDRPGVSVWVAPDASWREKAN